MARPQSDISARIVTAAAERFLHDGVDGASLRQIARDAGTNLGMVYYYFPTKDDLFAAVVERHYAPFSASLAEAIASGDDFEPRVRALFARFGAMTDDEFKVIRLVLREALVSSERLSRVIDRLLRGHAPALMGLVAEGFGSGAVDGSIHPVAALITVAALSMVPQVMIRRVATTGLGAQAPLPAPAELADMLCEVVLRGLRPARGERRPGSTARAGSPAPARRRRRTRARGG